MPATSRALMRPRKNPRAESARDVFLGEDVGRVTESDEFAVEKNNLIEKIGHVLEIVVRRDDQVPVSASVMDRGASNSCAGLSRPVNGSSRRKTCASCASDRARKARCCCPPERALICRSPDSEIHRGEGGVDGLAIGLAKRSPPTRAQVASHLDHSADGDGKIPIDHAALWQIGDVSGGAAP